MPNTQEPQSFVRDIVFGNEHEHSTNAMRIELRSFM